MSYVGVKTFEFLWEKYIPLKWHTCNLYIGNHNHNVDAWPKPILWWIIEFYWKPTIYLALIYNALSETVVSHVLFWKERIWKVIYSTPHTERLSESLNFSPRVWHISLFCQLHLPESFNHNAFCLFSNASFIWGEVRKG